MQEALRFFQTYELWIYLLLGLVGLFYLRKFLMAWNELKGAIFGLERESAQGRLNQAAAMLVLILSLMLAEFILTSFVLPSFPAAFPLFTPTVNLLATPTVTLEAAEPAQAGLGAPTSPESSSLLEEAALEAGSCIAGQINISSPQNGSEVRGIVEVRGSANIPNFGFYKLEMRRTDEQNWLTILAGNQPQSEGVLGAWNTVLLPPAVYQLRLVVVDSQGIASPPCEIQIRVAPNDETPRP
ncbi:MAG: hypothetical protein RML93_01705 [Anaerolineales bacterium]|nr:hypothetical protein [Anaerolineales bacterium]MCS7247435.1 hypothetical protein [Anaerolineales bacterium]MDW8161246.1 hypothetical protein [Anaerolineales bacterium]MDW8445988.1 hypothetical protein [Anaerolineales bacterium]